MGNWYDCKCGRQHAFWWGVHVKAPSCTLTDAERLHDAFNRLMRAVQEEAA